MSTEYLNYITLAGLKEEALAKEEGRKVTIEKVVIGLGLLPNDEQPQNQTVLLKPKAEAVCFVKAIDTEHGFYRVEADIPIPDTGYNYFEIGTLTDTGVLYSYARSRGDYVAGKADSDGKLTRIRLNFRTDNSKLITITHDDSVLYTPITDFEAHVENDEAHEQYERKDNAATDAEIDSESQEKKHVKLPQLWKGIRKYVLDTLWLPLAELIYPVGCPIPYPATEAPPNFIAYIGQPFDKSVFTKLAERFPSGVMPDMRKSYIRGLGVGEKVLSRKEQSVQPLGFKSDPHGHPYAEVQVGYRLKQSEGSAWQVTGMLTRITGSVMVTGKVTGTGDETNPNSFRWLYITRAA